MKIRQVIYVLTILMGILIEKYDLGTQNLLSDIFAGSLIGLGSLNLILDYFNKPNKGE